MHDDKTPAAAGPSGRTASRYPRWLRWWLVWWLTSGQMGLYNAVKYSLERPVNEATIISLTRAASQPNGDVRLCGIRQFEDSDPAEFEAVLRIASAKHANEVKLLPADISERCSLGAADPKIRLLNMREADYKIAREESRSAADNLDAEIWWPSWGGYVVYISREPLRQSPVPMGFRPSYSALFTMERKVGPRPLWKLIFLVPKGVLMDVVLGPLEWPLYFWATQHR